jgi:hypothetical protein
MDPKLRLVDPETIAPETETRELNANERAAAEVAILLEAIAERIPRLTAPNAARKKRAIAARTVRREYVLSMIDTIERRQNYQLLRSFDLAEARDTLEFNDAFRPIAARMFVLLSSLKFTMADRMAEVIRQALQAYTMAKPIAEAAKDDVFAAELELVAQDLNRKNKPKTKKKKE